MGIFARIEEAKASEGGNYLRVGFHSLELVKLKIGETRKKVPFFAADFKIIGTNSPDHRIGELVNWFVDMTKDAALGNVKAFATALLSTDGPVDPATITEEVMNSLVDKDGEAVAGSRINVQVTLVDTRGGNKFSKHLWQPAGAITVQNGTTQAQA